MNQFDGMFYNMARAGSGFNLRQLFGGRVYGNWFTFEPAYGGQAWFELNGQISEDGHSCICDVNWVLGGSFNSRTNYRDVAPMPMGTITFRLDEYNRLSCEFEDVFGQSDSYGLNRLIPPHACPNPPIEPPIKTDPDRETLEEAPEEIEEDTIEAPDEPSDEPGVFIEEYIGNQTWRDLPTPVTGTKVIHKSVASSVSRVNVLQVKIHAGDEDLRITNALASGPAGPSIYGVSTGDIIRKGESRIVRCYLKPSTERVYPAFFIDSDRGPLVDLEVRWSTIPY